MACREVCVSTHTHALPLRADTDGLSCSLPAQETGDLVAFLLSIVTVLAVR